MNDLEIFTQDVENAALGIFDECHPEMASLLREIPIYMFKQKIKVIRISEYFIYHFEESHCELDTPIALPANMGVVAIPSKNIVMNFFTKGSHVNIVIFIKINGHYFESGMFGLIDLKSNEYGFQNKIPILDEEITFKEEELFNIFIGFLKRINIKENGITKQQEVKRMKNNLSEKVKRNDYDSEKITISYREIHITNKDIPHHDSMGSEGRSSPATHFRRGHIRRLKNGKMVIVKSTTVKSDGKRTVVPTYIVGETHAIP